MKNLMIKKVALGLFLAGYAASGAFAAQSAITGATIVGNAPTITLTTTNTPGYSYKITRGGTDIATLPAGAQRDPREGDVVEIIFDYHDVDGDGADNLTAPAGGAASVAAKFEYFLYDTATSTITGNAAPAVTGAAPSVDGDVATYTFTIPSGAAGKMIGLQVAALSKFGAPRVGTVFSDNNMFGAGSSGTGTTPPGGGGPILPGTTNMGAHIIKSTTLDVYGTSMSAVQNTYTDARTTAPKLGEVFEVQAFDKNDGTGTSVAATGYTIQWYATGGNGPAGGSAAAADIILTGATAATITLPTTNSAALTAWGSLPAAEAGIQGFSLKVELN